MALQLQTMPITLPILRTIKEIPGFPGYFAGDDGTIWSDKYGRTVALKPWPIRNGHLRIALRRGSATKQFYVHALVLTTFVGQRPDGMEGCHYPDTDPANNRLENLRWDTKSENNKDRWRERIGWIKA